MAIYQVSYDLQKPEDHYDDFLKQLQTYKHAHRFLNTAWLVRSPQSADDLYSELEEHLFRKDKLLVIEVQKNYKGWLDDEAWAWIEEHLD